MGLLRSSSRSLITRLARLGVIAGLAIALPGGMIAASAFGDAGDHGSTSGALAKPVVGIAATPSGNGYWLAASDGGVFSFGDALFHGSAGAIRLNKPVVGIAATPSGNGYWLVASDGGVFSFGDATFQGSTGAIRLNQPVVGIASTPSGHGYWLVASDGGVFTFGDATFQGSTGAIHLNQPIVGIAATPSGGGYWLAAADGGVFAFGNAPFVGSNGGGTLGQTVTSIAATPDGAGYWLAGVNGTVGAHGSAAGFESAQSSVPVVGIARTPSGGGYWLATSTGSVLTKAAPVPTLPLPSAPSGGPGLGVYVAPANVGGIDGLNQFGNDVGKPVTYAMVYLDAHTDWNNFANQTWILDPWTDWLHANPNRRVILAVPMLQVSSAGDFYNTGLDHYFVELAQQLRDRGIAGQTIIRLGYEMNGDWMPWGRQYSTDGSGFRTMWRRIVPQMKAVAPLTFDWNIVPDTANNAGAGYGPNFYPGDDVVDVVGIDLYDHWVTGNPDQRWAQTQAKLDWTAGFAATHAKKMSYDEWGLWNPDNSQGGGDNPTYITGMLTWATNHNLAWTSYFNSPEGDVNTTLQNNPNSLNSFRRYLAGS